MLELADRLHSEKTFELAIRVANHYNMPQVAARISRMMAVRFPPLIEEVEEEQQSQPVYRRGRRQTKPHTHHPPYRILCSQPRVCPVSRHQRTRPCSAVGSSRQRAVTT